MWGFDSFRGLPADAGLGTTTGRSSAYSKLLAGGFAEGRFDLRCLLRRSRKDGALLWGKRDVIGKPCHGQANSGAPLQVASVAQVHLHAACVWAASALASATFTRTFYTQAWTTWYVR